MRLIDADAAADCLQRTAQDHRSVGMHTSAEWHDTMASLLNNERCFPTVDAAPVVHARWKTSSDDPDRLICSACGRRYDMYHFDQKDMPYCLCGAKMDEDE